MIGSSPHLFAALAAERLAARWGVPFVQSMHTLGKVKNLALAAGDSAEPAARIRGEGEVIAAADRLVANTAEEARQLVGGGYRGPLWDGPLDPWTEGQAREEWKTRFRALGGKIA